jgi:hypothetical protein
LEFLGIGIEPVIPVLWVFLGFELGDEAIVMVEPRFPIIAGSR